MRDSNKTQFPPIKCGLRKQEIQHQKQELEAENSKPPQNSHNGADPSGEQL